MLGILIAEIRRPNNSTRFHKELKTAHAIDNKKKTIFVITPTYNRSVLNYFVYRQ